MGRTRTRPRDPEAVARYACRECILKWLAGHPSRQARKGFRSEWRALVAGFAATVPGLSAGRRENYDRLFRVVEWFGVHRQYAGQTVHRRWEAGCTLLNHLGERPLEALPELEILVAVTAAGSASRVATLDVVDRMFSPTGAQSGRFPARLAGPPVRPRPRPALTRDETVQIHDEVCGGRLCSKDTVQAFADLLVLGLRKSEAAAVRPVDFDWSGQPELHVRGTKSPAADRRVPLAAHPRRDAVTALRAFVLPLQTGSRRTKPVLLDPRGWPFRVERLPGTQSLPRAKRAARLHCLEYALERAARRASMPWTPAPHDFRHASMGACLSAGWTLERIAKAHGHAALDTTLETYIHSAAARQADLLARALTDGRGDAWIPAADIAFWADVSKQAVYARLAEEKTGEGEPPPLPPASIIVRARGNRYVRASQLVTLTWKSRRSASRTAAAERAGGD